MAPRVINAGHLEVSMFVPEPQLKGFLKLMTALAYVHHNEKKPNAATSAKLDAWNATSSVFLRAFRINATTLNRLVQIAKLDTVPAKTWDVWNESVKKIGADLKAATSKIESDTSLDKLLLDYVKDVGIWCRATDKTSSYNRMHGKVTILGDNDLTKNFADTFAETPDEDKEVEEGAKPKAKIKAGSTVKVADKISETAQEQRDLIDQMKVIVKKLTGKPGERFTVEQAKALTNHADEKKKALYKQYLALNSAAKKIFNAHLNNLLRASGKNMIDFSVARQQLAKRGLARIYLPTGFEGNIGLYRGKVALFTSAGNAIQGMPAWTATIYMNAGYDADADTGGYVFKIKDPNQQEETPFYTITTKAANRTARFDLVKTTIDNVDTYRAKWVKDIMGAEDGLTQACAVMVELIYETQARIGDPKNSVNGESTYGLSTLLASHVKLEGTSKIHFSYPGKKGVPQDHVFVAKGTTGRKVISVVKAMLKGKKDEAYVFTQGIRKTRVTAKNVNDYMKSLGLVIGPHKLRHVRGTIVAKALIDGSMKTFKPTGRTAQSEAEKYFKGEIAEKTAHMLGHKKGDGEALWSTSVSAYISPDVSASFFERRNLRTPEFIQKLIRAE
jgi:hypothetical protein